MIKKILHVIRVYLVFWILWNTALMLSAACLAKLDGGYAVAMLSLGTPVLTMGVGWVLYALVEE